MNQSTMKPSGKKSSRQNQSGQNQSGQNRSGQSRSGQNQSGQNRSGRKESTQFADLLATLFRPHPWHGISPGDQAPKVVRAYIEIVPAGAVKLELDKRFGHLMVDRPQRFSSMCPTLYGFVPQTYCGDTIADLCRERTRIKKIEGDGDPLDICVLTEKDFAHGDLIVNARPIGGLRMVDRGQADDKIIAVLDQDIAYGHIKDISECPEGVIDRLRHYFLSYKLPPGKSRSQSPVRIPHVYGRDEAYEVIRRSRADYDARFGSPEERLEQLRLLLSQSLAGESNGRKAKRRE